MYIECKNLMKTYRSENTVLTAVDNVNFKAEKGEFVVILGHSGSGKTTLLSLIGGLTTPNSGTVCIENIDNWQQTDGDLAVMRNKKIGFIFQFASLIPTLTALENVLLPLSFTQDPQGDLSYAMELLERVGLSGRQDDLPGQLSGGQQRRVAIARSFINRPSIILADEPTGDLDETTEKEIFAIFRKFNQSGVTFLVVTHNKDLALSQDNPRTFQMKDGSLSENLAL